LHDADDLGRGEGALFAVELVSGRVGFHLVLDCIRVLEDALATRDALVEQTDDGEQHLRRHLSVRQTILVVVDFSLALEH